MKDGETYERILMENRYGIVCLSFTEVYNLVENNTKTQQFNYLGMLAFYFSVTYVNFLSNPRNTPHFQDSIDCRGKLRNVLMKGCALFISAWVPFETV